MRSDYALYAVALIFFAITLITIFAQFEFETLSIMATTVLGLLFVGLGYTQRPRAKTEILQAPLPPPVANSSPVIDKAAEVTSQQKTEANVEPAPAKPETAKIELTAVKGIKEKRAEQLKVLGVGSVEELAKASAKDLAGKLKISPKFTEQWIENAKELLARS